MNLRRFGISKLIHQVGVTIWFGSEVESPREADAVDVLGRGCCCVRLRVAIHDDNDVPTGMTELDGSQPAGAQPELVANDGTNV